MQRSLLLAFVLVIALVIAGFMFLSWFAEAPPASSPGDSAPITPSATDVETGGEPGAADERRIVTEPYEVGATGETPEKTGTAMLRVVLEGITEESARRAKVTLAGVGKRVRWPAELLGSVPCQGLTSEFDLEPFLASVTDRDGGLRIDALEVSVNHPLHFVETTRVPLTGGAKLKSGQTVYEVVVRLVPPVFWPEFTLVVRDAATRAHLEDVELRFRTTSLMGVGSLPAKGGHFTSLGAGLSSPIVLLGGREANEPAGRVAGLALRPPKDEAPRPATLSRGGRVQPERGTLVFARAPGYAWDSIVIDVSAGGERELLLEPGAALDVRMTNVQLEHYAALGTEARLRVVQPVPGGGESWVWLQTLDEALESEGLRLEALKPGEYVISVELGREFQGSRPVLAREELSLDAGETGRLVLALAPPPLPPKRATLGGSISFPAFGGEDDVRLHLYAAGQQLGGVTTKLSLAELSRVDGPLPTWSFRIEDLPVGLYQLQLRPFQTNWMIELPAGGREDVRLEIPALAEVRVETVDARTGERIPIERIGYRRREKLSAQARHDWVRADFEREPGRFHFWTAPGAGSIATFKSAVGLDYEWRRQDVTLVPGLQSVRFEFAPVNALRFELRVGEASLPHEDGLYWEVLQGIRALDHDGRATPLYKGYARVSEPGAYEVSFVGVGADRFHPIPTRRVEVRPGETTVVNLELRRK